VEERKRKTEGEEKKKQEKAPEENQVIKIDGYRGRSMQRQRSGRESNGRSARKLLQKREDMVRRGRKRVMRREQQEGWMGWEEAWRNEGSREGREEQNFPQASVQHSSCIAWMHLTGVWKNLHLSGIQLSGIVVINFIGIICIGEPGVRKGLLEPFLLSTPRVR